ncbi:MAG: 2,5-diamino-6-(ribosylamino)-4(3H)-pyrimidinone 5'-phosphate reductase, partial [Nitrososphaerales archaeon]
VVMNAAMTLDGKIATRNGDSKISSRLDLARVHRLRTKVDAILVGINTVRIDNPRLLSYGRKNPIRVVVDSRGRIGLRTRIMHTCDIIPTIIALSEKAPKAKIKKIQSLGGVVLVCGKDKVDLKKLLTMLKDGGINKLLVEGGGEINWTMLKNNLVDEVMVTVAPRIVGGRSATTLVEGKGFPTVRKGIKLKLAKIRRIGSEMVLSYKII